MLIANSSSYPTDDVVRIVRFAFQATPSKRVGVEVYDLDERDPHKTAKGRAYSNVPAHSTFRLSPEIGMVVCIHMGKPSAFPADNLTTRYIKQRHVELENHVLFTENGERRSGKEATDYLRGMLRGDEQIISVKRTLRGVTVVVGVKAMVPYGGKKSPEFHYLDWQEGLLAYAAHEARHIWQFQRRFREWKEGIPRRQWTQATEWDAEQHAYKALETFRRERRTVLEAPVRTAAKWDGANANTLYAVARLLGRFPEVDDGATSEQ